MDARDLDMLGKRMPTEDLIRRAEAIDVIKGIDSHFVKYIEALPSAQPMRKKGRWIDETLKPWGLVHHPYKCDQCGEHSEANSNFCPHCGADMRGDAE